MGAMALLILFAFVAGAGTAITPCVLPVLPALLSAGATGGRRRPLGIVVGLAITFTITIAVLATVIDGVGLADGATRTVAIVVLLAFGIVLAVPAAADRLEAPLSRLARFGPRTAGSGFWSGLLVGGALGFVYAPCAGPILAAVVSVSASQGTSAQIVAIAIGYGAGSAVVLLLLAYGGRAALDRVRRAGRGPQLQRVLGAVMVITAMAMSLNLDVRFQTALANDFPSFLTNPTRAIERSGAVEDRLADLRGSSRFDSATAEATTRAHDAPAVAAKRYRKLGAAPDFQDTQRWFNTPGGRKLSLRRQLKGKVVLVDFWTYTCINCLRTLPKVTSWDRRYRDEGLAVVGVHTPEFAFEHDAANVKRAVAANHIRYPVAQDNDYGTWNAWGNQFWPAKYLIDAKGQVRYTHFGEGGYRQTEDAIRALLAERDGRSPGAAYARGRALTADAKAATPETYLGAQKAQGFAPGPPVKGTNVYRGTAPGKLAQNRFSLDGEWKVGKEGATAVRGASLNAKVVAAKVYLVLRSEGETRRTVGVEVDGKPVRPVIVTRDSLYTLVSLPRAREFQLRLRFEPGVTGYAFTFG
jgi:cytochrome c biogenesis protein CcdA/thiol-disulfide isomerase/thioredoxin